MAKLSPNQRALVGPVAFLLFGGLLLTIGGRFIVYQHLLSNQGERVIGTVIEAGRDVSEGTSYLRYRFEDGEGHERTGRANGYSGREGETILLEYARGVPAVHRVAGAERTAGFRFRWWVFGCGLLAGIVGTHTFLHTRDRQRLIVRLVQVGARATGTVTRVVRSQRTVEYSFTADDGSTVNGRTLTLDAAALEGLDADSRVNVLYEPGRPRRNVTEVELG